MKQKSRTRSFKKQKTTEVIVIGDYKFKLLYSADLPKLTDSKFQALLKNVSITTINWTFASHEEIEEADYNYVHKNIYEMSLKDFKKWYLEICTEEIPEDIIKIEKIDPSSNQSHLSHDK